MWPSLKPKSLIPLLFLLRRCMHRSWIVSRRMHVRGLGFVASLAQAFLRWAWVALLVSGRRLRVALRLWQVEADRRLLSPGRRRPGVPHHRLGARRRRLGAMERLRRLGDRVLCRRPLAGSFLALRMVAGILPEANGEMTDIMSMGKVIIGVRRRRAAATDMLGRATARRIVPSMDLQATLWRGHLAQTTDTVVAIGATAGAEEVAGGHPNTAPLHHRHRPKW